MEKKEKRLESIRQEARDLDSLRQEVDSLEEIKMLRKVWEKMSMEAASHPLYTKEEIYRIVSDKRNSCKEPNHHVFAYAAAASIIVILVAGTLILLNRPTMKPQEQQTAIVAHNMEHDNIHKEIEIAKQIAIQETNKIKAPNNDTKTKIEEKGNVVASSENKENNLSADNDISVDNIICNAETCDNSTIVRTIFSFISEKTL